MPFSGLSEHQACTWCRHVQTNTHIRFFLISWTKFSEDNTHPQSYSFPVPDFAMKIFPGAMTVEHFIITYIWVFNCFCLLCFRNHMETTFRYVPLLLRLVLSDMEIISTISGCLNSQPSPTCWPQSLQLHTSVKTTCTAPEMVSGSMRISSPLTWCQEHILY